MENKPYERALTLGVKSELRKKWTRNKLMLRVKTIFLQMDEVETVIFSIEDYSTTGNHVHVYYKGKPIYWKSFIPRWEIGYVKDRLVYDRRGWIRYIKKQEDWHEMGQPLPEERPIEREESIIERFVGIPLQEEVRRTYNKKFIACIEKQEILDDDPPDDFSKYF